MTETIDQPNNKLETFLSSLPTLSKEVKDQIRELSKGFDERQRDKFVDLLIVVGSAMSANLISTLTDSIAIMNRK